MTQTKDNSNAAREAGHTPGPWRQNDHPHPSNQLFVHLGNGAMCEIGRGKVFEKVTDEDLANARLIAACPAMYDYIAERAKDGCEDARKIIDSLKHA